MNGLRAAAILRTTVKWMDRAVGRAAGSFSHAGGWNVGRAFERSFASDGPKCPLGNSSTRGKPKDWDRVSARKTGSARENLRGRIDNGDSKSI